VPERQEDNQGKWKYDVTFPGMDLLNSPVGVQQPRLVESYGVDGRFMGSARAFPGFADLTIHGIPTPGAEYTIPSISSIEFARYAAIRKGTGPHTLKGLVYFADNQGGTGKALYFAYRDSEDGTTDVVCLEDFASWTDFNPTSFEEYDLTHLGRYVYFVNSGDTSSTVSTFANKGLPYNKAYFWDFKVNDWDKYIGGLQGRLMGLLPQRCLAEGINKGDSDDTMDVEVAGSGGGAELPQGDYTLAAELISQKHNLRSYLRLKSKEQPYVASILRWEIDDCRLPDNQGAALHQLKGNAHPLTSPIYWGMPHCDGFRLWRTPRYDTATPASKYALTANLYKVDEYISKGTYNSGSSLQTWHIRLQPDQSQDESGFNRNATYHTDEGLITQEQWDNYFHEFGPAPRMKRFLGFDGMLVGVTDIHEPSNVGDDWEETQRWPEAFVWSALHLNEPENFPTANYWPLDDPAEHVLSLEAGSSTAFAVTNNGVYRVVRNGGTLSFIKSASRIGGVSRYSQAVIGNSLYFVSQSGVKEVDGYTGQIENVQLLHRLVTDDNQWAKTLNSIHMEYDAFSGCLILLNTSLNECVLFWEATGAVTKLKDCPWVFLTSGPDVLSDGANRAFFVTAGGGVQVIDAYRQMGKRTMCGAGAAETVNGTVTSGSSTQIIDSAATFPANCEGFKAYILSGDCLGNEVTITTRVSDTTLTVSGLSGSLAVDDRYTIAPIYAKLTFPQLPGDGVNDPFVAKIVSGMSVAFSNLAGETSYPSDMNALVTMGVKDNTTDLHSSESGIDPTPDKCVARVNGRSTRAFPYIEMKASNMDWEVQSVLIHGTLSGSEAQSRQGTS